MGDGSSGKNDWRSTRVDETPLPGARTRATDPYVRRKARRYVSQFERYRSKLHRVMSDVEGERGAASTSGQVEGSPQKHGPADVPPPDREPAAPPFAGVPQSKMERAPGSLSKTCSVCGRPILPNRDNACAEHLSFARMQAQLRRKAEEKEKEEEDFVESFEIRPKSRKPSPTPRAPAASPLRQPRDARRTPPGSTFWERVLALGEDRRKAVGYALLGLVTLLVFVKAILLWIRFFTL